MPINYTQVLQQLQRLTEGWHQHHRQQTALQEQMRQSLQRWFQNPQGLQQRLHEALNRQGRAVRLASPWLEQTFPLDLSIPPGRWDTGNPVWLAADGSQILPSQHHAFFYGLVNVAVLCMDGQTVRVHVHSQLYLEQEFPNHLAPEAFIQEERLQAEHRWLSLAAQRVRGEQVDALRDWPVIPEAHILAMADGPLELWGQAGQKYQHLVQRLQSYWQKLRDCRAPLIGYVDRPRANLLTTLLALVEDQPAWATVTDEALLQPVLPPGHRTPLFRIETPGMQIYPKDFQVGFFYLNVGLPERPALVRIELHEWTLRQPGLVEQLHAALWGHLQLLPNLTYPYLLHRAHQEAVVTHRHQQELDALLQRFWLHQGKAPRYPSPKQTLKDRDRNRENLAR